MNIAILEVFYEYDYVSYYTIRLEIDEKKEALSETDKFYQVYDDVNHPHFNEFDAIMRVIDAMGYHVRGAEAWLFRPENAAHALPPNRKPARKALDIEILEDSQLRLYCIRLTSEVVILLNGGIKTQDNAQDCPNVRGHFSQAQAIAKAIDKLMIDGSIMIEDTEIINNTGEQEIVIYF